MIKPPAKRQLPERDGERAGTAVPWLELPIRLVALVVVVPVRVVWESLVLAGRFIAGPVAGFLHRYLVSPVVWVFVHLIWRPVAWVAVNLIWRPLAWVAVNLVWRPVVWVATRVVWPVLVGLGRVVEAVVGAIGWLLSRTGGGLRPVFALLGRGVRWCGRMLVRFVLAPVGWLLKYLVLVPLRWSAIGVWWLIRGCWRMLVFVLVAFGRGIAAGWRLTGRALAAIGRFLRPVAMFLVLIIVTAWRGTAVLGRLLYRFLLRPAGRAIAWVWNHSAVPVGRAIAATWRWLDSAVYQPVAANVRSVRAAVRSAFGRP